MSGLTQPSIWITILQLHGAILYCPSRAYTVGLHTLVHIHTHMYVCAAHIPKVTYVCLSRPHWGLANTYDHVRMSVTGHMWAVHIPHTYLCHGLWQVAKYINPKDQEHMCEAESTCCMCSFV